MALIAYVVLLAASHLWQLRSGPPGAAQESVLASDEDPMPFVEFPTIGTLGRMEGAQRGHWPETTRFAYHFWPKDPIAAQIEEQPGLEVLRSPILYLHGAPGRGGDAAKIARHLNARGYDVYAPDLLGFGQTTNHPPDCSFEANAIACLRLMEALDLPEVHVVAHSQGGGIAIHMADMVGEEGPWRELRVPTVTLMGAIGAQETEGSGSYAFEQARYEAGLVLVWTVRNAIPHFGLIGTPPRGFLRAFADSDQRPLRGIMERMTRTRVLILHGRHDFLVPPWAAALHERFLPNAWLVMTPHSHFMPFIESQAAEAAWWIDDFCRGYAAKTKNDARPPEWWDWPRVQDAAPVPRSVHAVLTDLFGFVRFNLAITIITIAAAGLILPRLTLGLLSGLVACLTLDYGVAALGMTVACVCSRLSDRSGVRVFERPIDAPVPGTRSAALLRALASLPAIAFRVVVLGIVGTIAFSLAARPFEFPLGGGWLSLALGLLAAMVATWLTDHLFTRTGRCLLVARFHRWARYEFWPSWLLYLPLVPHQFVFAVRAGHPLAFTACNTGISHGGGFIGESKAEIHARLIARPNLDPLVDPASPVCPTFLIPADPSPDGPKLRTERFLALVRQHPDVLSYPIVIKPDSAFRGFGFKLVYRDEDARSYFESMLNSAVVQPYHPGPHEVGVLWTRSRGIFSITLKEPPILVGDGKRSLRDLILAHPRFRLQARTFFTRHRRDLHRLPARDEHVRLAVAGNHCQGTLFRDGAHLITPALNATTDRLCKSFGAPDVETDSQLLDFARLDIRCRSLDDLAAGRLDAWSIVELNGTSAESTNIYDPDRSLCWALARLIDQWRVLYAMGGVRMKQGHRPLSVLGLFATMWKFYRQRTGSSLAD